MPTQGSNIPVLTAEKFWLDKDGRGLNVHADGLVSNQDKWTNTPWCSGANLGATGGPKSGQFLPVASSMGWLKITWISGTGAGGGVGFIPIFSGNIIAGSPP